VAFKILADGQLAPVGHQKIPCQMVFDVKMEDFRCKKMEDFRCKARLVTGSHKTEALAMITYASIVSCKMVRIALTLAALNDLEVKAGIILNAYIMAQSLVKTLGRRL
jgi:hypothetical protein